MRCPRCNFEGDPLDGGCARCGYGRSRLSASSSSLLSRDVVVASPIGVMIRPLVSGDSLRQGRYRIVEQVILPRNQRRQGMAWLANDTQALNRLVMLREIGPSSGESVPQEPEVRAIAQRLAELGRYPGLPHLTDMFSERGNYYIVLQHIEGKSLAQLVEQQDGALPERLIADYGRQLCDILTVLSSQQPVFVHGAITPETVIVSPDGQQVTLIHLPLFPPVQPPEARGKTIAGYAPPEQVNGSIDERSDLYGVTATLYHGLTGYDPEQHMAYFYPQVRRLNPQVTPRMEAILAHGLRMSASQRYARPADMLRDIQSLLGTYPKRVPVSSARSEIVRRPVACGSSSRTTMVLFAMVTIVVFALLFGGILFATLRSPVATGPNLGATATANVMQTVAATQAQQADQAATVEMLTETQSFGRQGPALSDGRFIFDNYPGRLDTALKNAAAVALQHGDMDTAASKLAQAVSADPIDGEAQIYNQNLQIIQNGLPYVTIVLGLNFDIHPGALAAERADLEATALAQYEVNEFALLPHNLQLRILIAGTPSTAAGVETAAQFIANRVIKADNTDHIIGVVGWPAGMQTLRARDIIAGASIPIVSPTAGDVNLAGNPYFFRADPPYNAQGDALGTVAVQQLHARSIMVLQASSDPTSLGLAAAFISQVQTLHGNILPSRDSFVEMTTSVVGYQALVHDAGLAKADLMFLPGTDVDAVRLAHAVGNAARDDPKNAVLANLKILGGTGLASNLLLGQGNTVDALIAREFPQDMQRLHFISFADASEWQFAGVAPDSWPTFFTEWAGLFQNNKAPGAVNAPPPDQNAIMTYDALWVIARAASYLPDASAM
ncbi:MAG: ABC transporter substrate-binding protein, partial [Chloroflexota bacterium]|nr:ABC transporter substrate-binding protein [Chloroflexota bacterium]